MSFLTLMGGLFVFGLVWLLLPRAAFAVALMVIFSQVLKVNGLWEQFAGVLFFFVVIIGAVLDIIEVRAALDMD